MLQGVAPESRLRPIDPDRRGSACHERNDLGCEPLQALDALRDGLAAAIENLLVHGQRRQPQPKVLLARKADQVRPADQRADATRRRRPSARRIRRRQRKVAEPQRLVAGAGCFPSSLVATFGVRFSTVRERWYKTRVRQGRCCGRDVFNPKLRDASTPAWFYLHKQNRGLVSIWCLLRLRHACPAKITLS